MLIVTDLAAVDNAYAGAVPRPIEQVMLEAYPDATRDCNGRYHAPYDGYECPFTGQTFRAGEFLPFEEDEEARVYNGPSRRLPEAVNPATGKTHTWDGTRGQLRAVWGELISQTRAHEAATSRHLGVVGQMADFADLTIEHIAGYVGTFGAVWIYVMKDGSGNVVVYKGSKRFERTKGLIRPEAYKQGEKVTTMRAKIKAHNVREGVAQTIVAMPKLKG